MLDAAAVKKIRALRAAGLSVRGVARKLGVARQSVRKYETGDAEPGPECFAAFLRRNRKSVRKLFARCGGNCAAMARELGSRSRFAGKINTRTLQNFCREFREEAGAGGGKEPGRAGRRAEDFYGG